MTIETARDKRLKVDASRSPFRVEGELPSRGAFSEFASLVGDRLGGLAFLYQLLDRFAERGLDLALLARAAEPGLEAGEA